MVTPAHVGLGGETIEIRELCGPGCSHPPGCTAIFRNGVVQLDVQQEICGEAQFGQCKALPCIQRITRCALLNRKNICSLRLNCFASPTDRRHLLSQKLDGRDARRPQYSCCRRYRTWFPGRAKASRQGIPRLP